MPSASETIPTTGRYRLLGHPTDLAGHVAALGPVPLPTHGTRGWRDAFVSMLEASGLAGRAAPASRPPSSSPWRTPVGPAAPSS